MTRSGGPGLQRYAQTWTGDNRTDWKTLRYNLRMGHGLSLSGIFNFGHDVGGFAGKKPEPELFMRWIEQGIYWPRFTIHSWNDDGSANEPWMYPEILPLVRAAMEWRERLVPLLYTLMWRAHAHHEPILRPLFFDFPDEAESYEENDAFMLGRDLLVAPIVEPGAVSRSVWLPKTDGGWYDLRTGALLPCGEHQVEAPLGAAPAFIRAGSILPLGPSPSWADGPLTLRLFPLEEGETQLEIYDDDGESFVDRVNPPCLIHVSANWRDGVPSLQISKQGDCAPSWAKIHFEDAAREPMEPLHQRHDLHRFGCKRAPFSERQRQPLMPSDGASPTGTTGRRSHYGECNRGYVQWTNNSLGSRSHFLASSPDPSCRHRALSLRPSKPKRVKSHSTTIALNVIGLT